MAKATVKQSKIVDLTPDSSNANKGTQRGQAALEASLRKLGAGRSILIDRTGRIIAGNKTAETAADIGLDDVLIVQTDGKQLVAVQRTDIDLDTPQGREMAYADNRVGQLDLDFDIEQILADVGAGIDLSGLWHDYELRALTGEFGEMIDPSSEWTGMPSFDQNDASAFRTLHIHFASEDDVKAFQALVNQAITDKTKYLWFPPQEKKNLKAISVKDAA